MHRIVVLVLILLGVGGLLVGCCGDPRHAAGRSRDVGRKQTAVSDYDVADFLSFLISLGLRRLGTLIFDSDPAIPRVNFLSRGAGVFSLRHAGGDEGRSAQEHEATIETTHSDYSHTNANAFRGVTNDGGSATGLTAVCGSHI